MTAPAVQRLGPAVLLQGQAVLDVRALMKAGLQYVNRADGIPTPPRMRELLAELNSAADTVRSASGHADVRNVVDLSPSEVMQQMSTQEAAAMLNISTRQVRRLAEQLDARKVGRGYVFDAAAVQAAASARLGECA